MSFVDIYHLPACNLRFRYIFVYIYKSAYTAMKENIFLLIPSSFQKEYDKYL